MIFTTLYCISDVNGSVYIYIVIVIVIFISWSPFIPSRNLDEVFTYNHVDVMSLRSRSLYIYIFFLYIYKKTEPFTSLAYTDEI